VVESKLEGGGKERDKKKDEDKREEHAFFYPRNESEGVHDRTREITFFLGLTAWRKGTRS